MRDVKKIVAIPGFGVLVPNFLNFFKISSQTKSEISSRGSNLGILMGFYDFFLIVG
ncbi:MAG: hypothetical protein Ct9H90mP2_04110 [Dehalococcoidia bacterium]|nr:MAG: hypothetical protein Ct9H90mP2_04110 [Dehalococcoidia bacterium]